MYIDKSTINFTNGKQFCGKTLDGMLTKQRCLVRNKNQTPENVQDREISEKKNQTPVRGQDGKISNTRGKDLYWSPTRRSLVGDQKSFPWVSEIFPSCPLTDV